MKPSTGTIEIVEYDELVAHFLRTRDLPTKPVRSPIESPYLSAEEAAAYCAVSVQTIYNSRNATGYPRRMPGLSKLIFSKNELDSWLATRRKPR